MSWHAEHLPREKIILSAAPTGARRTKHDHPALPMTEEEIAEAAIYLVDAGASLLHLHVRDRAGRHCLDADRYREATDACRDAVGDRLVIQISTEAMGRHRPEEQMALVRALHPEAVSLALRELCPRAEDEARAGEFFRWLVSEHIMPQYILYGPQDLRRFDGLRRAGLFGELHPFALFVLGRYASDDGGDALELARLLSAVDAIEFPWAVCAFGQREAAAALAAVALGGHCRLGFENNLHLADGSIAPDNAALLRQLAPALAVAGRRAATAHDIRRAFEIW